MGLFNNKKIKYLQSEVAELEIILQYFKNENENLKKENGQLNLVISQLKEKLQDYQVKNKKKNSYITDTEEFKQECRDNLDTYYEKKPSFFYPTEQKMFYCLSQIISKIPAQPDKKFDGYHIFANARLADFIKTIDCDLTKIQKEIVFRNISSKHVDFLICKKVYEIDKKDMKYQPYFAIEVNGYSHNSDKQTIENDALKRDLIEDTLGMEIIVFTNDEINSFKILREMIPFVKQRISRLL